MDPHRPSRWRRGLATRRETTRRMLAGGALIGLLAGVLALGTLSGVSEDIRHIAQLAMLLPVGIFVAWWLLVPGIALDRDEQQLDAAPSLDVQERVEQIQAAFDSNAVPRVGEHSVEPTTRSVRDELRRSIRRPANTDHAAAASFGIRRERRDLG